MDCSLAVWSMSTLELLTSTRTAVPVHDVRWDPYACNEFCTVGSEGTLLFWLLDETSAQVSLNVHEAELPQEISTAKKGVSLSLKSSQEISTAMRGVSVSLKCHKKSVQQ